MLGRGLGVAGEVQVGLKGLHQRFGALVDKQSLEA
jgi:hypothetical protein